MKLIYKLFKKNTNNRDDIITMTSGLGVVANIFIAGAKVIIGALVHSIAIISEGANNATDALSSIITLIGTKLSKKHPTKKHPFGYGRIEYITGLVIATLILVTGIEMLISAIKLIFNPEDITVDYITLIIIGITAVIKFFLGLYTIKMGKKSSSQALIGVGKECRNDAFVSLITIASAVIFLLWNKNLDAYAGVLTSLLIIKAGAEVLFETLGEIIGRPGDKDLAIEIYKLIVKNPVIHQAADMMLHNYGPDQWSGSVNVEIDHEYSVGEVYRELHKLQLDIMHNYHVTMVFGIYAVDNDHEDSKKLRKIIADFVIRTENVKSYHAVYIEPETNDIYCDFIVNYELKDWDKLQNDFKAYMKEFYPDNNIILTIETEFV